MTHPNRRTFLGAMGALAIAGQGTSAAPANDRVRLAIIGVRGRGADLAQEFAKQKGAEVVALCDVDDDAFAKAVGRVEKITGKTPRLEKDFRKLLDDKEIDAVAIATPDHWHALMTVMACQAGKDVYTEKPASHNVVEGRRMIEAARKYKRIVQLGTQRRSADYIQDAVQYIQSGEIGHVGLARAWLHQKRTIDVSGPATTPPPGVDYALWQGPALDRPYIKNRFFYNWHWFWNWGTGEVGNNGVHGVDVARWGLGVDAPTTVSSGGGLYVFDGLEVPDTQVVTWNFPEKKTSIVWEHRMWSKHGIDGSGFGIAFYGDKGTVIIDTKSWRAEDGPKAGGEAKVTQQSAHVANFLDCVKSREAPHAEIEIGHASTRLCHVGNIAHRVGKTLTFDAKTESFPNEPEANKLLSREYSSRFEMPSQV